MKKYFAKNSLEKTLQGMILIVVMLAIGSFTTYASVNTYEVIARKDLPYSNVISNVSLTKDAEKNSQYFRNLKSRYEEGSFGIPKKIKLPEADRHIDIVSASYDKSWKASKGIGHTFLTEDDRQKVFGQSIIYMRVNTPTTHNLGDVFNGDVVNIVTTEGWQLGYQVQETAGDPGDLNAVTDNNNTRVSQITVILIDEEDGQVTSFVANLTKVGERI